MMKVKREQYNGCSYNTSGKMQTEIFSQDFETDLHNSSNNCLFIIILTISC